MDSARVEIFMSGSLLKWLGTLPEAPTQLTFGDLASGPFLHNVLQSFDPSIPSTAPRPPTSSSSHAVSSAYQARVANMELLVKKLKAYYMDVLHQYLVVEWPSPLVLGQEEATDQTLEAMNQLLMLILGAAVQCSQKEHLIGSIKNLPLDLQHEVVNKIKEVTDNPGKIWSADLDDPACLDSADQKDDLYGQLVSHVKRLVQERDQLSHQLVKMSLTSAAAAKKDGGGAAADNGDNSDGLSPERSHLALEVSEFKAKIRKLNQQLEEKTEILAETKEEMEKYAAQAGKLRQENLDLAQEARAAKAFRDELDILRERANKVDRLEAEMQRYKDKVSDVEYYKSRVDELREDNKILVETKEMLEEQLDSSRKRCEQILALENEILGYKSELGRYQLEREADRQRLEELQEENLALQMSTKNSLSESKSLLAEVQVLKKDGRGKDTNILTEQIDKDVSRIHRLELENKKLQSELETSRVNGFHDLSDKILGLEKTCQKQAMEIRQLETLHAKETQNNADLERELGREEKKSSQQEQVAEALKESLEKTRIEKDTEIDNLNKQVDALRKRQEQSLNEQLSCLDKENKKLVKESTLLQTQVNKLEHEKRRQESKSSELQSKLECLDLLKLEKEKLNSRLEDLSKENEELRVLSETHEATSESFAQLDEQNRRLTDTVERFRGDNKDLSVEKARMAGELRKLNKKLDSLQEANQRIPVLESERDELRDTINKMRIDLDVLSLSSKRGEEQESRLQTLTSDNNRLQKQLQSAERRSKEYQAGNESLEEENRKLAKTVETYKDTARKVDQLERENFDLESRQQQLERENKSVGKEVARLRLTLEEKDVGLEELNLRATTLEREKTRLRADLAHWNEEASKVAELETKNRELSQNSSVDRRALVALRAELVEEKIKCDNVNDELGQLRNQLEKLGIDQDILEGEVELVSNERMKNLEGSMTQLLESRQKRILAMEVRQKEAGQEKTALLQEVELLKLKVEAGDSKAGLESHLAKVVKERDQVQGELLNLQVEADGNKAKFQLYEKKMEKVQQDLAEMQVENSTLHSQSSSLLAQINQLQVAHGNLEAFKRKAEETERRWHGERADLLRDQAGLQKLHDNLQQDYDNLMKERDGQKETERGLRADLRKMQSMSLSLSEGQDSLLRAKEQIDLERENLRADTRTLSNLRSEHARLKDDFRSLYTSNERVKGEYCALQTDYKALKTSYNQLRLGQTDLKGQLHEAKEQVQLLDVELSKAMNRVEVLSQMNNSLEEDRRTLMSQVSILLSQYQDLLTQTLDDKEHFHEEEKNYTDKMNNLNRQKEKLEEKIMEQFKRMENTSPKKMGIAGQIARKMRKASSTLIPGGSRAGGAVGGPGGAGGSSSGVGPSSSSGGIGGAPKARSLSRSRSGAVALASVGEDGHDSSSVGSGCNDSLDSGQHSPNEMSRSESAVELGRRQGARAAAAATTNGSRQQQHASKQPQQNQQQQPGSVTSSSSVSSSYRHHRKSLPLALLGDDSDGNNADNDSVSSLVSGGTSYLHGLPEVDNSANLELIPNQSFSSHSDVGIPINQRDDIRQRAVTRVYVNGGGGGGVSDLDSQRSSTPKLTGWKSGGTTDSSPNSVKEVQISTPPVVPARKPSRISKEVPPQRPPKPGSNGGGGGSRKASKDNRYPDHDDLGGDNSSESNHSNDDRHSQGRHSQDDDADDADRESSCAMDDEAKKNTEWYEYGCV